MSCHIAIQPDKVRHRNGEVQSFSGRWLQLAAERGIEARKLDVFAPDFFDRLAGSDGFMWRFGYKPDPRLFAKRLLLAIEHGLGIPVFPSSKTAWHFEDKVAQHYLLQAAGIPTPATWVFWRPNAALAFCREAAYPLVMKLSFGFQSANVHRLHNAAEAEYWIEQMFGRGLTSICASRSRIRAALRTTRGAVRHLAGKSAYVELDQSELQQGYFCVQEFLPGNDFDTRVTVIGDRAFAFRRFNRPNDFRASGSGRLDWDPAQIDLQSVRLAYRVARRLDTQSVAVDVLRRCDESVISEISYTYASWALRDCPGHWMLHGSAETGPLQWIDGKMAPEDAIFDDFVAHLLGTRVAAVM